MFFRRMIAERVEKFSSTFFKRWWGSGQSHESNAKALAFATCFETVKLRFSVSEGVNTFSREKVLRSFTHI